MGNRSNGIPDEVERILSEGVPTTGTQRLKARPPSKTITPKPSNSPGDAIRKLKF